MASVINQINIDNTNYAIAASAYAECSTAAATVAKVASIVTDGDTTNVDFTLIKGVSVKVKFTYSNTASNPTLNINGTGAKYIKRYGTTAVGTSASTSWRAGAVVELTYDGTNWVMTTSIDDNTDTNTHNSHAIISGTKSDGSTQITGSASSGNITLGDSGVTAGTYKRVTVNAKGIVVGGDNTDADTNTWRKVQLNGTDKLGTGTSTNPLNIKAGSNMSITESNGTFTFSATDTNTNTSHSHSAGVGLTSSGSAGTGGGTYTYKAKLRSETALTVDSAAATTTSGRVYPVAVDKTGYLAVNVPWVNSTNFASPSHTHSYSGTVTADSTEVSVITGVGADGTATALTGVKVSDSSSAAPGGHTHSYNTYSLSGSNSSHTARYMKASSTAADTGTVGISGGSGSLVAQDSEGNEKVSNGNKIPFITSLAKDGYTPAGSVSLTDGDAPSMDFNTGTNTDTPYISAISGGTAVEKTTKYLHFSAGTTPVSSASPGNESKNTGSAGGGTANQKTGEATGSTANSTAFNTGGASGDTTTATCSTSQCIDNCTVLIVSAFEGSTLSLTTTSVAAARHEHEVLAHSHGLNDHTHSVGAHSHGLNSHTHTYTKPAAHTHTYDKTTSISLTAGTAPSLSCNTTSTNGIAVITSVSGGSAVSATTKYMKFSAGTTPKASASFSGTNSTSVVTGGTTRYLVHGHTGASLTGTKTFTTNGIKSISLSASTNSADGPAYVAAVTNSNLSLSTGSGTTGENSGNNFNAATKVSPNGTASVLTGVKATSTASVSPHGHTHTYSGTTGTPQ